MKNKETIDEALERLYPFEVGYDVYDRNSQIDTERERFIEGVKWREERSFTLDQIDELFFNEKGGYFDEFLDYRLGLNGNKRSKISFKEWFENYKNEPSSEIKGWCTDNVLTYVVIRTSEQELYVKEHKLDLIANGIMGDVYVMVTKSEHPYLFNDKLEYW